MASERTTCDGDYDDDDNDDDDAIVPPHHRRMNAGQGAVNLLATRHPSRSAAFYACAPGITSRDSDRAGGRRIGAEERPLCTYLREHCSGSLRRHWSQTSERGRNESIKNVESRTIKSASSGTLGGPISHAIEGREYLLPKSPLYLFCTEYIILNITIFLTWTSGSQLH